MAVKKNAPVESTADINRRNQDFYKLPDPPVRREGRIVDEKFERPQDEKFRWPDGRRPG